MRATSAANPPALCLLPLREVLDTQYVFEAATSSLDAWQTARPLVRPICSFVRNRTGDEQEIQVHTSVIVAEYGRVKRHHSLTTHAGSRILGPWNQPTSFHKQSVNLPAKGSRAMEMRSMLALGRVPGHSGQPQPLKRGNKELIHSEDGLFRSHVDCIQGRNSLTSARDGPGSGSLVTVSHNRLSPPQVPLVGVYDRRNQEYVESSPQAQQAA